MARGAEKKELIPFELNQNVQLGRIYRKGEIAGFTEDVITRMEEKKLGRRVRKARKAKASPAGDGAQSGGSGDNDDETDDNDTLSGGAAG